MERSWQKIILKFLIVAAPKTEYKLTIHFYRLKSSIYQNRTIHLKISSYLLHSRHKLVHLFKTIGWNLYNWRVLSIPCKLPCLLVSLCDYKIVKSASTLAANNRRLLQKHLSLNHQLQYMRQQILISAQRRNTNHFQVL